MTDARDYLLDDLASLTGLPVRTVRYYIQLGLVDRPHGAGKGARYAQTHVEQLLTVRKWQQAGLALDRIAALMKAPATGDLPPTPRAAGTVELWSHLVVANGVEIQIEPGRAGLSPAQVRELFAAVIEAHTRIRRQEEPT